VVLSGGKGDLKLNPAIASVTELVVVLPDGGVGLGEDNVSAAVFQPTEVQSVELPYID